MTDSLKLFLGNKQVLVETNEIPISNNAEETFNDTDTKQSDINKTFKKEIEDRQKNLVNTDNTINLTNNVDTNNVDISLNISESEKIITKSQEGLTTNISLNFNNNELQLKGKDNQLISSAEIISSVIYRGVFNDIASAKYILADTLANKDIILVITDNKYYQYNAVDTTFNIVDDVNIINSLKNKQDTIQDTENVKIENNISTLKDETGNDITDLEGNVIKEVKKNIVVKNQDNSSDIKFLGLYKDNTAIKNYKNGDIIYNNGTRNYQSFNADTSTWNDYNDLRTLQSIKSFQTSIALPKNSPLQFSKRLKEGSTVELEEVLTSNFTRFRWDMDRKTYDDIVNLSQERKYNGDIFRLKDNSVVMYVCEDFIDEKYNVMKMEDYVYIIDNRRVNLSPATYIKPFSSNWNVSFSSLGMWLKNDVVELNGYISISGNPSVSVGYNDIFKINTTKIKTGYIIDTSNFISGSTPVSRNDWLLVFTNSKYYSTVLRTKTTNENGVIEVRIYCTNEIADSLNNYGGGLSICGYFLNLIKKS